MKTLPRWFCYALAWSLLLVPPALYAGNGVMGELEFHGKSRVEKTSGVWIDGQYVGYLKELKGTRKVLLLPGEHWISVRQTGYQDFTQTVSVNPGEKRVVQVAMQKAPTGAMPAAWSTVKLEVNPNRAAVFLDGRFVGHVGEFEGLGRSLMIVPGDHHIKIALPGYKTFETEISPLANQKVEVKTDLLKTDNPLEDPSLKGVNSSSAAHPASVPPPTTPQR